MPEHVLMSEIENITDGGPRRRWSATEKLRIVEETLGERASISVAARRNGVAPNLLYRWRRLMLEGGVMVNVLLATTGVARRSFVTISSGLCLLWGIPASSKGLKSLTQGGQLFRGQTRRHSPEAIGIAMPETNVRYGGLPCWKNVTFFGQLMMMQYGFVA